MIKLRLRVAVEVVPRSERLQGDGDRFVEAAEFCGPSVATLWRVYDACQSPIRHPDSYARRDFHGSAQL
jgi:hypothetical protein